MLITKPGVSGSWNGVGIYPTVAPPSVMGVEQPAWWNFKQAVGSKVRTNRTTKKSPLLPAYSGSFGKL